MNKTEQQIDKYLEEYEKSQLSSELEQYKKVIADITKILSFQDKDALKRTNIGCKTEETLARIKKTLINRSRSDKNNLSSIELEGRYLQELLYLLRLVEKELKYRYRICILSNLNNQKQMKKTKLSKTNEQSIQLMIYKGLVDSLEDFCNNGLIVSEIIKEQYIKIKKLERKINYMFSNIEDHTSKELYEEWLKLKGKVLEFEMETVTSLDSICKRVSSECKYLKAQTNTNRNNNNRKYTLLNHK